MDGYVTLNDILGMACAYKDLNVEINLNGEETSFPYGKVSETGDFVGMLESRQKGTCTGAELADILEGVNDLRRQAFIKDPYGDIFMITSVDHIEFDEFNLIELYAEPLD